MKMAAMNVVMFESMIAQKALLKPVFIEDGLSFPRRRSSLMRSKMITFASTAIPIVRIIPAIVGNVIVRLNAERIENMM